MCVYFATIYCYMNYAWIGKCCQVSFITSNASGYVENLAKVQTLAKYQYNMNYYLDGGT